MTQEKTTRDRAGRSHRIVASEGGLVRMQSRAVRLANLRAPPRSFDRLRSGVHRGSVKWFCRFLNTRSDAELSLYIFFCGGEPFMQSMCGSIID